MAPRPLATYFFALALVYAPFAHGCVTDQAWFQLDVLLLLAVLVYAAGRASKRRWPVLPLFPLLAIGLLVLLAALQTANPKYLYDPVTRGMTPLPGYRPGFPGTMDQRTSITAMLHWGALALAFLAMVDLFRNRAARWFLLGTMAATGGAMAIFGIVLKIQGSLLVPFTQSRSNTFFGTYVYHAHAAAFLDFCWPAAGVLAIRALSGDHPFRRALWINVFLLIYLALFINISKFGHLVAFPGLVFALGMFRKGFPRGEAQMSPWVRLVIGGIVLAAVTALVLPVVGRSIGRWDEVMRAGFGGRPVIYGVAWSMVREYPLWGTGPGTFHLAFPYFTAHLGNRLQGLFTHAHQDYLQTAIEWGAIGAGVWLALVVGGFLRGWREHFRRPEELSTAAAIVALTILGLHALVDFPLQIGSLRLYAAVFLAMLWRARSAEALVRG